MGFVPEINYLVSCISKCITVIINQSLTSRIFPNSLKIAKVTPIFRKENNKLITNYRPISVLPVISKIFETVIHEQLSEYFISNNLFCPKQYGFRKNSSTELAALELLDRVLDQMDKHKIPINFHIDLSKVFDSLRHDILLDILTYYGVTHPAKKTNRELLEQSQTVCSGWQHKVHYEASLHWSSTRLDCWTSPF